MIPLLYGERRGKANYHIIGIKRKTDKQNIILTRKSEARHTELLEEQKNGRDGGTASEREWTSNEAQATLLYLAYTS